MERNFNERANYGKEAPLMIYLRYPDGLKGLVGSLNIVQVIDNQYFKDCRFVKKQLPKLPSVTFFQIYIPIEEDQWMCFEVDLWKDDCSYLVKNVEVYRMVPFPDPTYFKSMDGYWRVVQDFDNIDISQKNVFQAFHHTVSNLEIPPRLINKEKEQQIWKQYVTALRHVVKSKEVVWQIQSVGRTYRGQRDTLIDIQIAENQPIIHLEQALKKLPHFKSLNLKSATKIVLQCADTDLQQKDIEQISQITERCGYKLLQKQPFHYLKGQFRLKFDKKTVIIDRIQQELHKLGVFKTPSAATVFTLNFDELEVLQLVIETHFAQDIELPKNYAIEATLSLKAVDTDTEQQDVLKKVRFGLYKLGFILDKQTLKIAFETSDLNDFNQKRALFASFEGVETVHVTEFFEVPLKFLFDSQVEQQTVFTAIQQQFIGNLTLNQTTGRFELVYDTAFIEQNFRDTAIQVIQKYPSQALDIDYEEIKNNTFLECILDNDLVNAQEMVLRRATRMADFVHLNPANYQKYLQCNENTDFRDGKRLGTLIKKDNNKLTLRLDEQVARYHRDIPSNGYLKADFPGRMVEIKRMVRAMNKILAPSRENGYAVNRRLVDFVFDPMEAKRASPDVYERMQMSIKTTIKQTNLDVRQLEAVAKAVTNPDLCLIQGPPGTGKTTVIAEIIWQILFKNSNQKVLLTSQGNDAVDNALGRLDCQSRVRVVRIGKADKIGTEGQAYHYNTLNEWGKTEFLTVQPRNAIQIWMDAVGKKAVETAEQPFSTVLQRWQQDLNLYPLEARECFAEHYLKNANVIAVTCSACGGKELADVYSQLFGQQNVQFDVVLLDEASKATPPELVLPLTLAQKVVLIGDHKQLPPMIEANDFRETLESIGAADLVKEWTRDDFKVSQFEKLFRNAHPSMVATLETQYRMHEDIMLAINQFYLDELENGLKCGIKQSMNSMDMKLKSSRHHGLHLNDFLNPQQHLIWVDVQEPEVVENQHYYHNPAEVERIYQIVRLLKKAGYQTFQEQLGQSTEIGVISFYAPQMTRLVERLKPLNSEMPLRIQTVDRFQGQECEVVIVSTVRSHLQKVAENQQVRPNQRYPMSLGFAQAPQRINVAFSRAKRLLIVVGNARHFSQVPAYKNIIDDIKHQGNFFEEGHINHIYNQYFNPKA